MNKFLSLLIPIFIFLGSMSSNAAQADNWAYVSESTDNSLYYVNTHSIKNRYGMEFYMVEGGGAGSSKEHTEAWWKVVDEDGSYIQIKSNFFCSLDIVKDTSRVRYSAAGIYINSPRVDHYASSVIPNTSFSRVFNLVCS